LNTFKLFAGSIAIAMSLSAARAGERATDAPRPLSGVVAHGAKAKATAAERREVEGLLGRARQAIKDGNFETADSLISRAEALKVDYGLFHVGDTPKKARQELTAKRGSQRAAPQRPSEQFKPTAAGDKQDDQRSAAGRVEHSEQPALGRSPDPISASEPGREPSELPALSRPDNAMKSPFTRRTVVTPPADGAPEGESPEPGNLALPTTSSTSAIGSRQQSDGMLLNARRALATGDIRRASALIEQAKGLNVPYGLHDDSPVKVEALIRKCREVSEQRGERRDNEAARRQQADLLMEQAEQLLRWKEFDEAERLAGDAARMKINLGPWEAQPSALIERINGERKRTAQAGLGNPTSARQPEAPETRGPARPHPAKEQALLLMQQSREALAAGDVDRAEQIIRQAEGLRVPDAAFGPQDQRPWMVALEVQKARVRGASVVTAGGAAESGNKYPTTQSLYDPQRDPTRNLIASSRKPAAERTAQATEPVDRLPPADDEAKPIGDDVSEALRAFQQGEQALRDRNVEHALELFRKAYELKAELDPVTAQRCQEHLQMLSVRPAARQAPPKETLIDAATAKQQLLARQLASDISKQQKTAEKLREKDPAKAMETLRQAKAAIEASGVEPASRAQMLRRVDLSIADLDKYINDNRAQIELDSVNKEVLGDVERRRRKKVDVQDKLAKLVDEFNTMMDERRYGEANVIAKRAQELDPTNPVVKQLVWQVKFVSRTQNNLEMADLKERAVIDTWNSVEESSRPYDDRNPIDFGDAKHWKDVVGPRSKKYAAQQSRKSESELEIERKLRTPVSLKFRDTPLNEVVAHLAKLAAVNMYLDPQGFQEEAVSFDTPVTIDLTQDISLRSALHLILQPLHLSYVIKDEVLKITSEQLRDGEVYTVTYNVADLVIPIPNFVPNNRMGLDGALASAHANLGVGAYGGGFGGSASPNAVVASHDGGNSNGMINPAVLAQMNQANGGIGSRGGPSLPIGGGGPGGMGGGSQADFDSLIDLVTSTIQPATWDEVGGPGTIAEFRTNLSLVVSQTQDVHEQIVDLLEQLRRLQDLQVTIEVRFITLNDNFFERIGVDFQFQIEDKVTSDPNNRDIKSPSVTVGLEPPAGGRNPNFTGDLDIPFNQSSFSLAVPQFGQPVDVARFGFAILSDIEAYFLVNAAQGDRRSNVLQAPKVTLFNGQQAFVSDTSQMPFVISVIPVVGDFAAAQQPVIVVLSEGTFLTVQAVISNDKRFVRLTVVPFFSQIGNVDTFKFTGSKTTTNNSSKSSKTAGDDTASANNTTTTDDGVTVQLPTFSFVTVTTTVSVPDGGTVLLGGIKRLSEGRNEFGVPLLSKVPYINRLFKNVGIGRETQSLMMMVTPRIIIQEEEESKLGIAPTP